MSKVPRKTKGNYPGRPETRVLKINLPVKVALPQHVCLRAASQEMEGDILKSRETVKGRNQDLARRADTHRRGLP